MIFNKEFVIEKFQEKVTNVVSQIFPFETNEKPGEVSSGRNLVQSYYQYFDLRSEEAKDLMLKARREINDVCFKDENLGVYPNSEKIQNCVHAVETKYMEKLLDNRNLYFGNGKYKFYFRKKNFIFYVSFC